MMENINMLELVYKCIDERAPETFWLLQSKINNYETMDLFELRFMLVARFNSSQV